MYMRAFLGNCLDLVDHQRLDCIVWGWQKPRRLHVNAHYEMEETQETG
jgi:hypothetical protein